MHRKTPSARPVGVLFASQQEWTSRSLASILGPQGYQVLRTYTCAQTLAHIRRAPPDAIIIDEELPDGDGHTLCRELYDEDLIAPSTPVFLVLSHAPTRRDRLAALRAGAWACVGDPLDAEELAAMLGVYVPAKLETDQARATGLVDESTGIYNARGLKRRAEELAAHAARSHSALSCVLLAADTESGTPPLALMRRIAAALRSTARQSDAIGRVGENAFAVVAVDTDAAQARCLAQRLAAAILAEPATVGAPIPTPMPFRVRAGFDGVPDFHTASIDPEELMLRATAALYRARSDSPEGWLQGYEEDGGSAG
ncbi:MAG: hypothetical protein DMD58_05930 [Gemmatimonadetes bacterium]|nr:MAG: hypothetical protein DMD58_05930 [Gemmatimonadota bacterium]